MSEAVEMLARLAKVVVMDLYRRNFIRDAQEGILVHDEICAQFACVVGLIEAARAVVGDVWEQNWDTEGTETVYEAHIVALRDRLRDFEQAAGDVKRQNKGGDAT